MLSSPEEQDTRPLPRVERMGKPAIPNLSTLYIEQPAETSRTTDPLTGGNIPIPGSSSNKTPITGQLIIPSTTRKLAEIEPITSKTRRLTHIPAHNKRTRQTSLPLETPPVRRRRHTARLITVLASSLTILIIATFFATPLGQSEQQFSQALSSFFTSNNPTNTFNPAQQVATPAPTAATLTTEGYCGGKDIWGTCATAVTDSGLMGTGTMQPPLSSATITQVFGNPEYQSWCGCIKPHSGVDLAAPYGAPVMAADNGQVIWAGWDWSGLGWAIKINHGHYIATIYGHLARFIVKVGQNVTKGDVIAYEGSTGASTGPHVHFMIMVNNIWVNPGLYIQLP